MERIDHVSTKEIQQKALEVLEVFKEVCREHHLTYMAIGGTCIGAIRHHGFIPWDDDIDVVMPKDDYRKFIEIAPIVLNYPYSIITPKTCKHYHVTYSKMQDEETTFVEKASMKYHDRYSGVFIDIFPIYGLPMKKKQRMRLCKRYDFFQKVNLRMRFPLTEEKTIKGKLLWLLVRSLNWFKTYYYYTDKQTKLLSKVPFNNSDMIIFPWRKTPVGEKGYKRIFYYDDFADVKEVEFEGSTINVPIGYDRYLTMDFGDYMELPPIEKRVSRHLLGIIDLKKSYKEFA